MKKEEGPSREERKQADQASRNHSWVVRVFFLAVILSALLSFLSSTALEGAGLALAVGVLLAFVALGILFDVIGVATTAADPKPFHSMASHRTKGAREALWLIKNAEKVSSVCNDVVGDICGIVSGSTVAVIVTRLSRSFNVQTVLLSIAVTALVSGLTIGGKAAGKRLAITKSKNVVYLAAKVLTFFHIGKA